jgi:hypothetical protein
VTYNNDAPWKLEIENTLAIYRDNAQCNLRITRMGICEVFQVERGSMYQLGKEVAFDGAVGIQMGVIGDSLT